MIKHSQGRCKVLGRVSLEYLLYYGPVGSLLRGREGGREEGREQTRGTNPET